MAPNDDPKMDELKRLLRRLDGLDARRAASSGTNPADSEQRDYVGSLRGAPELDGIATPVPNEARNVSPKSAALLAAVIAAMVSTATVYVLMSAEERVTAPAINPPLEGPAKGTASPANDRGDATMELVRTASALIEKGNIEGARELLRRAAELGSGPAALELARTYDAAQATPMPPDAKETNSTLARVWYERARELGLADAAPAQPPTSR